MQLLSKEQIIAKKDQVLYQITQGAVFVYPTDTVYGMGCSAMDDSAVKRLREIKQTEKQLSIIAPSKEWIVNNCTIPKEAQTWLDKLPGPYTLVLNLKNKSAVSNEVTQGNSTIGVRLVDHHFQNIVSDFESPIVTTSANRTGKEIMTHIDRLDEKIRSKVDFVLYEGEKSGKASQIIDLTSTAKILRE